MKVYPPQGTQCSEIHECITQNTNTRENCRNIPIRNDKFQCQLCPWVMVKGINDRSNLIHSLGAACPVRTGTLSHRILQSWVNFNARSIGSVLYGVQLCIDKLHPKQAIFLEPGMEALHSGREKGSRLSWGVADTYTVL